MDPNVILARIRNLAAAVARGDARLSDVSDLADEVRDLDEWISKGGFFPDAWSWNTVPA